jgi:4,5-DOPA dioxygenase extradiol
MPETPSSSTELMPVIFLAHGSPMELDDAAWVADFRAWARTMPRPKAILIMSAHWLTRSVRLGATRAVPLTYDMPGFPERFFRITYPSPGAPELAQRVRELVSSLAPVDEAPERGLDHGAFLPLLCMYPEADIPVLQVSVPTQEPARMFELGRALAPLRRDGVLLVGSGALTHNFGAVDIRPRPVTPPWAVEFDAWIAEVLARKDVDALLEYRERAPGVRHALPTHEHFMPVLFSAGAAWTGGTEPVSFPVTGFKYGSATRRSVQFG